MILRRCALLLHMLSCMLDTLGQDQGIPRSVLTLQCHILFGKLVYKLLLYCKVINYMLDHYTSFPNKPIHS